MAKTAQKKVNNTVKKNYLEEMETILLVKDNERYNEDLTVIHNGKNYTIKRGTPVEIPRFLKLIIEDSYRQQMLASEFSSDLENEFEKKTDMISKGVKID